MRRSLIHWHIHNNDNNNDDDNGPTRASPFVTNNTT
jgi:hypothetical protein